MVIKKLGGINGDKIMGTNYYWKDEKADNYMDYHIGKRSMAGLYCFDCGTTLNANGTYTIHSTEGYWLDSCPSCGKPKESLDIAYSFTWTKTKHFKKIIDLVTLRNKNKYIIDEYGKEYTAQEFIELLERCPIQFQLPREFS